MGACNAGKAAGEALASATAAALRAICPRCLRTTPRLINGQFCVSCFNRDRESQKGRNAKGGIPQLTARLHAVEVVVNEGGVIRSEVLNSVVGPVEAMLLVAKRARGSIAFSRPPAALHEVAA